MKTNPLLLLLLLIITNSCQEMTEKSEIRKVLEKIPQTEYTKIECPFEIDADTIDTNKINITLPIKNVGKKMLTNLIVKTTCDCTTMDTYPNTIKPNKEISIKINVDITEKGYFSKTVIVYGSFNPLVRPVNIIGYRK